MRALFLRLARAEGYVDDSKENDMPIIEWLRRRGSTTSSRQAEFDDGITAKTFAQPFTHASFGLAEVDGLVALRTW